MRLLSRRAMPNLLIIALPDKVRYFVWLPTGTTGSVFAVTWLYPQSTLDLPDFKEVWQMEKLPNVARVSAG
ncbi:SRPBCC family protein [Streptomyces sp. NPDC004546]|uniref:SRPBCC family protein n=1 Tax=Streptomyces sp. NPDC004546 TaxID=3154282 RepID=UPI0033AA244C